VINTLFYNTVLTGGIIASLILLVFLVSPALNKRYQATWRLSIWKVFMVFLIVPAGFILRFVISSEKTQNQITTIKNSVEAVAVPVSTNTVSFQMIAENQQASIWTKLIDMGPQWIPIIWGVGVCVVTIYLISVYIHFTRDIKKNSQYILDDSINKIQAGVLEKHKRKKPLSVYQCAKIPSPMIVGIFRPAIFIPKRDYTMADLQIILTHELTHYLRHDLPYKGLFLAALILHWYNPFVHMMTKAAGKDMEMCCDQDAIKGKDKEFKSDYSDVIMGEIVDRRQIKGQLFACIGCEKKTMEERFRNIFSNKKRKGGIVFLGALVIAVVISSFAYANDHDVPDFDSPKYQQLLEKTIADKIVADKARGEKLGRFNNRVFEQIPNYHELAMQIMDKDGNYDELDIYKLAGVEPPDGEAELKELEKLMSSNYKAVNNCIEPHIMGNGERAIYSTDSGEPWNLRKGQVVKLHVFADINRFGEPDVDPFSGRKIAHKGLLKFGYIKDGERTDVEDITINHEKQIEFEIPQDGKYNFYLFCPGSLQIIIQWISIDIK